MRMSKQLLAVILCGMLTACGTDTSSGDRGNDTTAGGGSTSETEETATPDVTITTSTGLVSDEAGFSLRLTDAPIDGLTKVVLTFTAVELKMRKQGWTLYTLPEPRSIDLLALQGLSTAELLRNMPIEPGEYVRIRFFVDTTPMANHVELLAGGVVNLEIPHGDTRGITLKHEFTIPEPRFVNFTVDFDLRTSVRLKKKKGIYRFKPQMRMVVDSDVGYIRGSIDPSFLLGKKCSDKDVDSHNAAYVYQGHDAVTDDINELSTTSNPPITTTTINYNKRKSLYIYEAAFLPEGDYTIALTCSADLDNIEADDDLPFFFTENVSIIVSDMVNLRP